jgi:hypothetical protein
VSRVRCTKRPLFTLQSRVSGVLKAFAHAHTCTHTRLRSHVHVFVSLRLVVPRLASASVARVAPMAHNHRQCVITQRSHDAVCTPQNVHITTLRCFCACIRGMRPLPMAETSSSPWHRGCPMAITTVQTQPSLSLAGMVAAARFSRRGPLGGSQKGRLRPVWGPLSLLGRREGGCQECFCWQVRSVCVRLGVGLRTRELRILIKDALSTKRVCK